MIKKRLKAKGVVKGASSGFMISLLVHAAAFTLAGMLVVFNVVKKEEKKFVPPKPVERPKMKLKKPQIKVRKTAKPKSTTRIVTKVKRASMPDIQLPEFTGMTEGLSGVAGGFELNSEEMMPSVFGDDFSVGNDLAGTFYSIMRDRSGKPISYSREDHQQAIRRFIQSGWKSSSLARYYRSPKKLYASMVMVPEMISATAPETFGESSRDSMYWMVHYKGQIVYPEDITFRFVAGADSTVAVRIDGKIVLGAQWHSWQDLVWGDIWSSSSADDRKWWMGNYTAAVGDWITLKAGESKNIDILIADANGLCCLMLAVQVEGEEYEMRPGGGPRLPAFKTAKPSLDMQDIIMRDMVMGEVDLTNGPVFNDFARNSSSMEDSVVTAHRATSIDVQASPPAQEVKPDLGMRSWTSTAGDLLEAEFLTRIGDKVVLKDSRGSQKKIPLSYLSAEDREYVKLCNPPQLKLSVSNSEKTVQSYEDGSPLEVIGYDVVYTAKIKKQDTLPYSYDLTAEFYAIGVQRYADTYILLDRQESTFKLTKENNNTHDFKGRNVYLRKVEPRPWEDSDFTVRGEKQYGYLIVVKDKRDQIIAHKTTSPWIFEAYDKLKSFPVGRYMNKQGERVFPAGPPRARY